MKSKAFSASHKNYLKRIQALRDQFKAWEIDGCIIDNPIDIFYLTGLSVSLGRMIINKQKAFLLVDSRYLLACHENSPVEVLSLTETLPVTYLKDITSLGFDALTTTYCNFLKLKALSKKVKVKAIDNPLKEIRAIKDAEEIKRLQKSMDLLAKGLKLVPRLLKVGITEQKLAAELEIFWRSHGALNLSFPTIVAFGKNSAKPHHIPGQTRLKKNDLVLIDCGVDASNYQSDITRVFFFGKVKPKLQKIHAAVKEAQAAALDLCKPGVTLGKLDEAARAVLADANLEQYFTHSLGHGVGIEIHEFPSINSKIENKDLKLKAGMVITIEPGVYVEGLGGARHEDTLLITPTGYKKFLKS